MIRNLKKTKGKQNMTTKENDMYLLKPSTGFIAKAVRQFYVDLKDAKNSDSEFVRVVKLATHSYKEIDSLRDSSSCQPKKARTQGAGCKRKVPEGGIGLFDSFIDVRETLKGPLPRHIFKMKANQLYQECLTQNPVPEIEIEIQQTMG